MIKACRACLHALHAEGRLRGVGGAQNQGGVDGHQVDAVLLGQRPCKPL